MIRFTKEYFIKNINKLIFLIIFLSQNVLCAEIQYFLSPYFFKNPQSYSINGSRNVNYNLGELFSKAIEQSNSNYYKCSNDNISDVIINLNPITFYNPGILLLQTDVKIRIYSLNKKFNELNVQMKEIVRLGENSDVSCRDFKY